MTAESYELRGLFEQLKPDKSRKDNPFSPDIEVANKVLFRRVFSLPEKKEAMAGWLHKHQPCFFGRIAAVKDELNYCLIDGRDLMSKSDQAIAAKIQAEALNWKRRALDPRLSNPSHGFVLLIYSQDIADAENDQNLFRFASKILELWGCAATIEDSGLMHWETLYLRKPATNTYLQFKFSVDFFAIQGDRTWWHDHRCPGGIMFTANSVGYIKKYREWYRGFPPQDDWMLQTAMQTIHAAEAELTGRGPATRLLPLAEGRLPMLEHIACPFGSPEKVRPELQDKDWTKYVGSLHTDHSIRREFFSLADSDSEHETFEHVQDFTYLYDESHKDFARFVAGSEVGQQEVDSAIGPKSAWQAISGRVSRSPISKRVIGAWDGLPKPRRWDKGTSMSERQELLAALAEVRSWKQ